MSKLDEEKIKYLVSEYQNGNQSVLNAIIKEISLYVYNFPLIVYNKLPDEAGEFYLYFMERLESCILNFKDKGYKFSTYLTSVLINHYKNFLLQEKRKTLRVMYESELKDISIFTLLLNTDEKEHRESIKDEELESAISFFNSLDEFSKLIIKVFTFELTPDDLTLISKYTKKPIEQVLKEYEEILKRVQKKYETRKKIIEKIQSTQNKKYIDKLNSLNTLCSYADVAKLLNLSISNVGVSLKRLREKFQKYLESTKKST